MIKNLTITNENNIKINKKVIHNIISILKDNLNFTISSFAINFVNSATILEINEKYLKHNYTTDIITFNYSGDLTNFDGEIFISLDDAKNNANLFNCTLENELLRLIIHGVLHLTGMNDSNAQEKREMRKKENNLISKLELIVEEQSIL